MKAMKYVGLVTLAAVTLGFATPAFADDFDTKVNVTVEEASIFTLEAVPSKYNFTTPVEYDGEYTGLEATTITDGTIEVFKGYSGTKGASIRATFDGLTVKRDGTEVEDAAEVTAFSIGDASLLGTADYVDLFADEDFVKNVAGDDQATGYLAKDITEVTLGFTGDVLPEDEITGTVTYMATDVIEAD